MVVMDNQKLLFKKFFCGSGSSGHKIAGSNDHKIAGSSDSKFAGSNDNKNSSPTGFNPPKFQFNKKKLGLEVGFNRVDSVRDGRDNVSSFSSVGDDNKGDTIKEIDSIEIEAFDETVLLDTEDTEERDYTTVIDTPTHNTSNNRDNPTYNHNNMYTHNNTMHNPKNPTNTPSTANKYDAIVEKNRQKYNLSSQLTAFSFELQNLMQKYEESVGQIDFLVLGIDEKIGNSITRL